VLLKNDLWKLRDGRWRALEQVVREFGGARKVVEYSWLVRSGEERSAGLENGSDGAAHGRIGERGLATIAGAAGIGVAGCGISAGVMAAATAHVHALAGAARTFITVDDLGG
jgi:hypothetical protein